MSRIVLVTPVGLDAGAWAPCGELARRARVYEMPGFGGRLPWSTPPTLDELADDLVEHRAGMLDLVGVSTGAILAQHVAMRHPQSVRSLLSACAGPDGRRAVAERRARDALAYGMLDAAERAVARWFAPTAAASPEHEGVRYVRATLLRQDPRAYAAAWRAIGEHGAAGGRARILAPTTVLGATEDAVVSARDCAAVAAEIPCVRLETVGASHMAQLDAPAAFGRAVRRHLAWCERVL